MSKVYRTIAAALLGVALSGGPAAAGPLESPAAADDVDALALAAVLLDGGHLERARLVLDEVDADDPAVDRARLFVLRGLLALAEQRFEDAATDLEAAVEAGATEPGLKLSLAQAEYGAGHFDQALAALDEAGQAAETPRARWLRADCLRQAGQPAAALAELRAAEQRFPREPLLRQAEVILLVELSLYAEALERADPWLAASDLETHLGLVELLRGRGAHEAATEVGERTRLRFGDDERVLLALGHTWAARGAPLTGAHAFESAARLNPEHAADAAELYRRAGWLNASARVGAGVLDDERKLRQRFGVLLERGRFEEVVALEPRLARAGLLADDELRYALAYACFRTSRHDAAEAHLERIGSAALLRRAAELRQAIAACREEGWSCR